jgi:ribosomal protein L16 Arg81 hydroxylase
MCLGDELFENATNASASLASKGSGRGQVIKADEHDRFIVQIEGMSEWSIFTNEIPDFTGTFTQEMVELMKCIWKGKLKQNDVLYIPKHQDILLLNSDNSVETSVTLTISN